MRWLVPVQLVIVGGVASASGDTCLGQAQLAGLVFGTSFATLLVSSAVALLLWCFTRTRNAEESIIVVEKAPEKVAYDNSGLDVNLKGSEAFRANKVDRTTSCHSTKQRERREDSQRPQRLRKERSLSAESLNNLKETVASMLNESEVNALGFGIYETTDGIFIHKVLAGGAAERSGNVFSGDKIKSLSICFEGILLEDATKLLGCASPYKVKLELERSVCEDETKAMAAERKAELRSRTAHRPLFRSASLDNLRATPSIKKRKRGGSWMSKQKYALQRRHWPPRPPSPLRSESLQEALPELASPTSSFATESTSTIPLSSLCDKSPSPSYPPFSTSTPLSADDRQTNGVAEFVEVSRYTFSKPSLIPRRVKKVEFCERIEPKRESVIVEFKENEDNEEDPLEEEQRGANLPPQIEISRVEKFERKESPLIIVRKLPPLPKMIEIPMKNERNGGPLYIEQKCALRKTFVPQLRANGGTALARERKERLDANRSLLQRQQDELRALGVLP